MTNEWEAVDITDEDDIAETITRRDYEDSVSFFRGLMFGVFVSVGPWILLAAAIALAVKAITS